MSDMRLSHKLAWLPRKGEIRGKVSPGVVIGKAYLIPKCFSSDLESIGLELSNDLAGDKLSIEDCRDPGENYLLIH